MLLFAQVDSAGKNSMVDNWDFGQLYMRPYDMDTQMGFSNTGTKTILSFTELVDQENNSYTVKVHTDEQLKRNQYNTKYSRLWRFIDRYYAEKLRNTYNKLRNSGVYSLENIMTFVDSKTYDVIGPNLYNEDGWVKYEKKSLNTNVNKYYKALAGDRRDAYFNFLKQRLVFLDSYFSYNTDEVVKSKMEGSEASEGIATDFRVYLTVKDPMYIRTSTGQYAAERISFLQPNK